MEWTYRYLASAHAWANDELAIVERIAGPERRPDADMAHRNKLPNGAPDEP